MTAVRFVENDAPCQLCHQREAFVEVTHEGRILAACPDCIEQHAAEANGEPPVDMDAEPRRPRRLSRLVEVCVHGQPIGWACVGCREYGKKAGTSPARSSRPPQWRDARGGGSFLR